jgi:hypothetical protein
MSKWEKYKEKLGETRPWDILNPNAEFADEDLSKSRYEICKICPNLINATKQCKECLCIMPAKVKLLKAVCPIGKW